jgi:hypothetical protein
MVVTVLFSAGLQEPVMPFKDVVGSAAGVPPAQIAAVVLKAGVSGDPMITSNVAVALVH